MDHETISQLCFSEAFTVAHEQTAAALFERLPLGRRPAEAMADRLAATALLAHLERLCIDALLPHAGGADHVVLSRRLWLDHGSSARRGERVQVCGFVSGLGERSVQFHVRAHGACEGNAPLAEGTLEFVVAELPSLQREGQTVPWLGATIPMPL